MDSHTENEVVEETPAKWDEREDSSVPHPGDRKGAGDNREGDQEGTSGENFLHEGRTEEDPGSIRNHPSERNAAATGGDSDPASAKTSRGEGGETRGRDEEAEIGI
ncbi:hypothetical protein MTP99_004601 [Tenebrio molitor]|nr:hypothetical protein MTP99_004601 [Tenebrio molitor]CAH1380629.1 unnamed protein product [Tenebrio molitor]